MKNATKAFFNGLLASAGRSVFQQVETFYNPVRRHQSLGYHSPDKFEAVYAPTVAA